MRPALPRPVARPKARLRSKKRREFTGMSCGDFGTDPAAIYSSSP
jgi:hypothetical protein